MFCIYSPVGRLVTVASCYEIARMADVRRSAASGTRGRTPIRLWSFLRRGRSDCSPPPALWTRRQTTSNRRFALPARIVAVGLEQVRCRAFPGIYDDQAAHLPVQIDGRPGGQARRKIEIVHVRSGNRHDASGGVPRVLVQSRVALRKTGRWTTGRAAARTGSPTRIHREEPGVQARREGGRIACGHQRRRQPVQLAHRDVVLDPIGVGVEILECVSQAAERSAGRGPLTRSLPSGRRAAPPSTRLA